jgi:hypothetical protein
MPHGHCDNALNSNICAAVAPHCLKTCSLVSAIQQKVGKFLLPNMEYSTVNYVGHMQVAQVRGSIHL